MNGTIADPTEQPTRTAASPGNASSIASQQASAMSAVLRPGPALGERPYPGMSMAIHRNQVEKCAIWKIQHD